jgi:hypothetical protein
MNPDEPNLLSHLTEVRSSSNEGGLSTVIYCGKFRPDVNTAEILQSHRAPVEDEVNSESANVTGILIVQVSGRCGLFLL